jgi:integrase
MPLTLKPPRKGRTPYWYVRGTFLGIAVDRSTQTTERRTAQAVLKRWEREIARGEYLTVPAASVGDATFLEAAVAYMKAGGERAFLGPIIEYTGVDAIRDKLLTEIDQMAIDRLAATLYPKGTPQTRNRQVYTPISAVLKRAKIETTIIRPKGWRGSKSISWLEPAQAIALFVAADALDFEFGLFLRFLCATGMRLGEALAIKIGDINLARQTIYLPETKNGDPRSVYLPLQLVAALAKHPRGLDRPKTERLIRYHAGGRLRGLLKQSMANAGLSFPRRQCGFHLFCHTYATWAHRGGLDNFGLVRTGRWKDPRSAERYLHTGINEEARVADNFQMWTARGK